MALSEFGVAFLDNLRDLNTPDRRSIVTLKDLAFENTGEASSVVRAIKQHIKQCPAAHRLPALYLVDCMLKTEPCPPVYAEQLSAALLEDEEATEQEEKLYFVEEDPSQPECAISGEPFERFYDPDSDKWCYKDAITLTGDDAANFSKDFDSRYTLGRTIGSGTFGTVHLATEKATGLQVAVKVITKRIMGGYLERHFVRRVQHEVDIYNHVGHSLNVAYMYGAYENTTQVQLVMELCTGPGDGWQTVQAKGSPAVRRC
ncbi:hypothetical protein GPECTOR_10g884 [Gonium pectorale]|uniref:Protein kinase domain-containing protein n=1 Tax=Gonium pectorale TaxID=33097 RepID=A0A150GR40_GONPE|nr:hypothetical protein GPECTOR_10g884 [Gonium pectorale]|eukprot:KXZ52253.1 hypothetical protein GPECTOR_10g884 [Gonium pectorale]